MYSLHYTGGNEHARGLLRIFRFRTFVRGDEDDDVTEYVPRKSPVYYFNIRLNV